MYMSYKIQFFLKYESIVACFTSTKLLFRVAL